MYAGVLDTAGIAEIDGFHIVRRNSRKSLVMEE